MLRLMSSSYQGLQKLLNMHPRQSLQDSSQCSGTTKQESWPMPGTGTTEAVFQLLSRAQGPDEQYDVLTSSAYLPDIYVADVEL